MRPATIRPWIPIQRAERGIRTRLCTFYICIATLSKIREGSSVPSSVVALTTRWQRWWCPWGKRRSRRTGRWTAWRFHTVKAVRFLQQLRIAAPPTTEIYVSALSAIHKSFATTIFLFESRIIYPFARVVILFFLILFAYTKFVNIISMHKMNCFNMKYRNVRRLGTDSEIFG